MADKRISDLPETDNLSYNSLIPAEQNGVAVKLTGALLAEFAQAAAKTYSDMAQAYAENAQQYGGNPPIIRDDTWWIWSAEQQRYMNTNQRATLDLSAINFYIDMETGNLCMGTRE